MGAWQGQSTGRRRRLPSGLGAILLTVGVFGLTWGRARKPHPAGVSKKVPIFVTPIP